MRAINKQKHNQVLSTIPDLFTWSESSSLCLENTCTTCGNQDFRTALAFVAYGHSPANTQDWAETMKSHDSRAIPLLYRGTTQVYLQNKLLEAIKGTSWHETVLAAPKSWFDMMRIIRDVFRGNKRTKDVSMVIAHDMLRFLVPGTELYAQLERVVAADTGDILTDNLLLLFAREDRKHDLPQPMNKLEEINMRAGSLSLEDVESLTDEEVLGMSVPRPGHPTHRGFMLSPKYFKDQEHFSQITHALMQRLLKVKR